MVRNRSSPNRLAWNRTSPNPLARALAATAAGLLALAAGPADLRANGPDADAVQADGPAADGAGADPRPAADDCSRRVAERVQARYDAVRDLAARFVQTTRSVSLGGAPLADAAPSRGRVVFDKPGRMRWSYESPQRSLVVSDGETVWIFDPDAGEAQRFRAAGDYLTGAALQFLLGEGRLLEAFEVEARDCASELVELLLEPKREASYERLALRADPRTGEIAESAIVDLFGNETRIAFSDQRVNLDPPEELFRFDPPEGVEVIEIGARPGAAAAAERGTGP